MMSDVKAILFDFGGTLDHDGLDWPMRIFDLVMDGSDRIDRQTLGKYAHYAFDTIGSMEGTETLLLDGTIRRVCQVMYDRMSQDEVSHDWDPQAVATRFTQSADEFVEKNRPALQELNKKFRLGCISNNWGNTAGWCRHYGLDSLFETMTDSTRVGCMKPDPRIYQAALDEMNLPANQCVYVGDRFDCDILGSRAMGMTPVWIRHKRSSGYAEIPNPDNHEYSPITIDSVRDLAALEW